MEKNMTRDEIAEQAKQLSTQGILRFRVNSRRHPDLIHGRVTGFSLDSNDRSCFLIRPIRSQDGPTYTLTVPYVDIVSVSSTESSVDRGSQRE